MTLKELLFSALLVIAAPVTAFAEKPAFEGEKTQWRGCDLYKFSLEGREACVAVPDRPLEGNPWVWRPAFFDAFPAIDEALLKEGFHIAYFNTTDEWGRPEALDAGQKFYELMVNRYGLMPKAIMEGLSRGGYYSLRRAQVYPSTVACLLLDNPLCDIFELKKNPEWWRDVAAKWNRTGNIPRRGEFSENAIYNIDVIARAGVPVLLLSGGADSIVPYEKNGRIIKDVYDRYGAPIKSIVRPGGAHHPHGLDKPEAVIEYLKKAAYGELGQHKGPKKVACIGNSITEGVGTTDPATKSYPSVLQRMLGDGYEVCNFGVSCSTALKKGTDAGRPFSYVDTDACRKAIDYNPDIVIIKLGGNDSKACNWQYKDEFEADYQAIIDTFKYLPSLPEIYICLPAKARVDDPEAIWGIDENVIINEITPAIKKIASDNRLTTINLHDAYEGEENSSYADNIHPSDRGAELIAAKIHKAVTR